MACTPSRVAEPAFVACSLTLQHLFVRPPPSRLKALRTSVSSFPLGHQKSVILMTFPSLRVTTLVLRFLSSYCHFSMRSEEHTSELQSPMYLVCRLLLE